MRRRALISATATALTIPLLAGCSRDDGGGGGGNDSGGGGSGPYGRMDRQEVEPAAGASDGAGSVRDDGPVLGPYLDED